MTTKSPTHQHSIVAGLLPALATRASINDRCLGGAAIVVLLPRACNMSDYNDLVRFTSMKMPTVLSRNPAGTFSIVGSTPVEVYKQCYPTEAAGIEAMQAIGYEIRTDYNGDGIAFKPSG